MDERSRQLYEAACALIPGGVNSPVRACRNVESLPLFIAEAHGAHIRDVDGRDYVDFVLSWGPMILGHDEPSVSAALRAAVGRGTSFGAPCPDEVALAGEVVKAMPGLEMVRMVNSGTEATMSALRLARAVTGRDKVVKFIGCYHGHADPFLAAAGSGVATLSIPGTPGVPRAVVEETLLVPYNDPEAVEACFRNHGEQIAAVIVEPVAANMGLVPPLPGFLEGLRRLTQEFGSLLIFDEVITGFRLAYGGAQARFGIDPDLTCFGKIIGGGLPASAAAWRAWPRRATSIRRARFRAIRWPWRRASPPCACSGPWTMPPWKPAPAPLRASWPTSCGPRACPFRCQPSPPCSAPSSAPRR